MPQLSPPRTVLHYTTLAARSLRKHGLWHSLHHLASECWFDLSHGTRTITPHQPTAGELSAGSLSDAVQYQGSNPCLVRALFDSLPEAARNATFVDYGCGKGRVLILAAEARFPRLIGVEFSSTLASQARANLSHCGYATAPDTPQGPTLWIGDAACFTPPGGPLVAFLYNPFQGATLEQVALRLAQHASRHPSQTWILYANPSGHSTFLRAGFRVAHTIGHHPSVQGMLLIPA
jgi:SAM-dependent methyltransferase